MSVKDQNKALSNFIADYSVKHNCQYTLKALQAITEISPLMNDKVEIDNYLNHCLSIAKMLIELNVPFSSHDMDVALASTLTHTLTKNIKPFSYSMLKKYEFCDEIITVLKTITIKEFYNEEEVKAFYDKLKKNKIALIVRLFERSNLVERLHIETLTRAKYQISETKKLFFPMGVYAKEHYPEFTPAINIIMAKMRSLIFLSEILMNRFAVVEEELNDEIINLQEENARIRAAISRLEKKPE